MSISKQDNNYTSSGSIQVFPASRRNVQYYGSRIMSEFNAKRSVEAAVRLSTDPKIGAGTFIFSHDKDDNQVTDVEFFIKGYYFRLHDDNTSSTSDCLPLKRIREALGQSGGTVYFWIEVDPVVAKSSTDVGAEFNELDCMDESDDFVGLFFGGDEPSVCYGMIPIVVPDNGTDGPGVFNPALDGDTVYQPWFKSSASFAASKFSDKHKIWIDPTYDVPHVCVKEGNAMRWIPLGAVYKTSR